MSTPDAVRALQTFVAAQADSTTVGPFGRISAKDLAARIDAHLNPSASADKGAGAAKAEGSASAGQAGTPPRGDAPKGQP